MHAVNNLVDEERGFAVQWAIISMVQLPGMQKTCRKTSKSTWRFATTSSRRYSHVLVSADLSMTFKYVLFILANNNVQGVVSRMFHWSRDFGVAARGLGIAITMDHR